MAKLYSQKNDIPCCINDREFLDCVGVYKFGVSQQILIKVPNIKFYEKFSVGTALVHEHREKDGRTDVTKLTGAFRHLCQGACKAS
jgi:hypothetical protein